MPYNILACAQDISALATSTDYETKHSGILSMECKNRIDKLCVTFRALRQENQNSFIAIFFRIFLTVSPTIFFRSTRERLRFSHVRLIESYTWTGKKTAR